MRSVIGRLPASVLIAAGAALGLLLCGCGRDTGGPPRIEFTTIPPAAEGGTDRTDAIAGRVSGAAPGQRLVLYARSGVWWVQPYVAEPFTIVDADGTWRARTHLGTQYGALLVNPRYQPQATTSLLPLKGDGIAAAAIVDGRPPWWQTGWFRLSLVLLIAAIAWGAYRIRVAQMTRRLNQRFEERLDERTRIAQELHDTLLQGFLSASMQLHVIADRLPDDSPVKPSLARVLDLMTHVIGEGRNAVRGLRATAAPDRDLADAFSRLAGEIGLERETDYRVTVEGLARPLNPIVKDELYRIGREALFNALRHAEAERVEVQLEYGPSTLRMVVRDDGRGIDADILHGGSEGHWGLSGMRERAHRIGAHFKVWSRPSAGTEIEVTVPADVAFHYEAGASLERT